MSARQMRRARERQVLRAERRSELRRKTKIAGAAGAAIGATALFAPAAQAATFTVNSLADPGVDGCDATECTLREAVVEANQAHGADIVTFAASLSGTIELTEGDIEIYDGYSDINYGGLDIQGPGPGVITVDANYDNRIFDVGGFYRSETPVRIAGMRLRAGDAERDGGAIRSWSPSGSQQIYGEAPSLTVDNVVITDSYAEDRGGAIFHDEQGQAPRSLHITNSRISDNTAGYGGGGVYARDAQVTITGSTIDGNTAGAHDPYDGLSDNSFYDEDLARGGGIFVKDASGDDLTPAVHIADSEVTRNHAHGFNFYDTNLEVLFEFTGDGGGIFLDEISGDTLIERTTISYNEAGTPSSGEQYSYEYEGAGGGIVFGQSGNVTVTGSTISGNKATKYAGGFFLQGSYGDDGFLMENSTVSGNEALGDGGGGFLENQTGDNGSSSSFVIRNSTITDNDAIGEGSYGGGLFADAYGDEDTVLSSVIVAENNSFTSDGPDLYTEFDSEEESAFIADHTIVGDLDDADVIDNGNNQIGGDEGPPIDPLIAPIANNGGPTKTHLPLAGSPALDAGISNGLATDQRGEPRTFDIPEVANVSDATDIGSVEVQGTPPPPPAQQTGPCNGSQVPLISGTPGGDVLVGTPGADLIRGGGGADDIEGNEADDCLFGEADDDILNGDSGDDLVDGGDGDDILSGVQGADQVDGGAGIDRVKGNAGDDTISGGSGKDVLAGGGGPDSLRGDAGNDTLRGAEAADKIIAGSGDDKIKGAGGDDTIKGGSGADRINCGAGDDVANAGPGDKVAANCETVK